MNKYKFKKSNITIFLFGLFFSSLLSYPFPQHLNGKDSFVMAAIAQSIINLATEKNTFTTGQKISISGGE